MGEPACHPAALRVRDGVLAAFDSRAMLAVPHSWRRCAGSATRRYASAAPHRRVTTWQGGECHEATFRVLSAIPGRSGGTSGALDGRAPKAAWQRKGCQRARTGQ